MTKTIFGGTTPASYKGGFWCLVLLMVLFLGSFEGLGQQAVQRVYADSESHNTFLLGNISNSIDAIDGSLQTHSTISIGIIGSVWQQLEFTGPDQPTATDAIRIKVGTQTGLLGLLAGVKVQAYNNGNAVGPIVHLNTLISLLNGADQQEVVFTPGVVFDAVRLTNTAVSLGGGLDIYEAYFYKPIPGQIACNQAVDILYGSTGNIAGSLNAVKNPNNAIDNNTITYATIRANVSALNKTHVTALFPTPYPAGDYVKIILKNPAGGLLNANVLATNFTIRTYNDNTDNGALALNPALLRLNLFPGGTGIQTLIYPVNQSFNRIQVSMGEGLVAALDELLVYEITRLAKGPDITGLPSSGDVDACEDESISFSVENPVSGTVYTWYTTITGGTSVATGTTYSPGILTPNIYTYYVSARKNYCYEESDRTPINLEVLPRAGYSEISVINTTD